jgi:hypothetical protein
MFHLTSLGLPEKAAFKLHENGSGAAKDLAAV